MSGREEFYNLMDEFEEKRYAPLCFSPKDNVRNWKTRLMRAVDKIECEARNGISDDEMGKEQQTSKERELAMMSSAILLRTYNITPMEALTVAKALYDTGYRSPRVVSKVFHVYNAKDGTRLRLAEKRKEQQIKEMAGTIITANMFDHSKAYATTAARTLYSMGYRKLTPRAIKILRQARGMVETRKEVEREFLGETE